MAYRLVSHHRSFFSPHYISGSASCLTANAIRRLVFDVKSQQSFEDDVINAKKPILIDFHADWCGPCKVMAPRLNTVLGKFDGKVDMAKVNVDEMQDLAMDYGIMSVPTVIGMKNGKVIGQFVGAKETTDIEDFVQRLLDSE